MSLVSDVHWFSADAKDRGRDQKVRAAEAMIAKIVLVIAPLLKDRAPLLPLLLDDEDIFHLERSYLSKKLDVDISPDEWKKIDVIEDLGRRIKERRMFVRAYAFASNMPKDTYKEEPQQRIGMERLGREVAQPERREELIDQIAAEVARLRLTAGNEMATVDISDENLRFYIALDAPNISKPGEISRAFLITSDGGLMRFSEDSGETAPWSNAYLMTRDIGFIFTIPELASAVFLASEVVMRNRYGLRTGPRNC